MEKNIVLLIRQHMGYLNPALKRIATYILENLEQCKTITTKALASTCEVAESTVTRFVREIGFSSFQEFKISIAEYLTQNQMSAIEDPEQVYEDLHQGDTLQDIVDKLVYRNTLALTDTQKTIHFEALEQAVELIEQAETLIFCCQGFSTVAGKEAMIRFIRAGKKGLLCEDESVQLMLSSICTPKDVVIGISNTGRTTKVVDAIKTAHSNGCPTIAITSFEDSPLVKAADVALFTPTKSKGATGITWESASAKTAQVLIIDILCACYTLRHYRQARKSMEETYCAIKNTRYSK